MVPNCARPPHHPGYGYHGRVVSIRDARRDHIAVVHRVFNKCMESLKLRPRQQTKIHDDDNTARSTVFEDNRSDDLRPDRLYYDLFFTFRPQSAA